MASTSDDLPYRLIYESIQDGILLTDLETGLVIAANPAAAAMHGFDRDDFIGLRHLDFLHPTSLPQFAAWVAAVRAGDAVPVALLHIRRDGAPFAVEVRGSPCPGRETTCLLSVVREAGDQAALVLQAATDAALEERRRLARNLHDAVNQSLFSASLIAEVLPRLWKQHPDEVLESLEDLRRLTRGALAEMRGLLVDLQPLELTDTKLGDLLRLLGDAFTGRTNIPVAFTTDEIGPLPGEVQVALYRLCQEALNNVAKHSGAGQVAIELRGDAGVVEVSIRDDGRGFDPEKISSGHFGLSMMHERAAAIGAAVSVASRPGQGAAITIRWPDASGEVIP